MSKAPRHAGSDSYIVFKFSPLARLELMEFLKVCEALRGGLEARLLSVDCFSQQLLRADLNRRRRLVFDAGRTARGLHSGAEQVIKSFGRGGIG